MAIDYKKLYEQNQLILTNADPSTLANEAESVEYMREYFKKKNRFIPPIDFSNPASFVRFGSAEKYYIDAIDRIYKTYPYDGSLKERIQWELSSSYFDLYMFDNSYPRTNGYVIFSADGWGTQIANSGGYGAPATSSYEYISIEGGPHTSRRSKDKNIDDVTGDYSSGYSNFWDPAKNRECNLKIGGIDGNTVEFWMKKSEFVTSRTGREVIFDAYTENSISSSADYGRLTIELTGTTSASPFRVTYMSGTSGLSYETVGSSITTASIADNLWHHYAFTFKNSDANVKINFYVDGGCNQTVVTGSSIEYVSGAINGSIAALSTAPSGTIGPTRGWGKFSGSIDEFRFWKSERNSQKIGLHVIEPVGGGTNTDDANTDLGVYYKFNEGITQTSSVDRNILDYSGRISNGIFVGYNPSARNIGSAMVDSGLVDFEFKDPILYSFHPAVAQLIAQRKERGQVYDYANNASIYHTLPGWIISEDDDKPHSPLRNLIQIVGSYFDSVSQQISYIPKLRHKSYLSASLKAKPFSDRLLESIGFTYFPELFSDATVLEYYRNRSDQMLFEKKLYDVKNRIYQNIYNNIVYIYKTKGTEKSFRNLIHCFGVGDEIYRINTYGDRVKYRLKDNFKSVAEYKKYINFGLTGTLHSTVFPHSSSANSNSQAVISASNGDNLAYLGLTMESEIVFPIRHSIADSNTVVTTTKGPSRQFRTFIPYTTASLFGMHQIASTVTGNDLTWATNDYANFQVKAIKDSAYSKRCKFVLTGTAASVIGALDLSSNYFDDVFNDTRWTFSVSVKPTKASNQPSGSSDTTYDVEFYGIDKIIDINQSEFLVTGTLSATAGKQFLTNPKAPFIGAHRTNFSGSVQERTDGNISSTRVWLSYLSTGTIQQHQQDVKNYGVDSPYRSTYLYPTSTTGIRIPQIDTLVLSWTFDTVTGSNASGEFLGEDYSSGSVSKQNRYGWLGEIVGKQYLPKGYDFPVNSTSPINKKYVYSAKKQLPEIIQSSDMVNVLNDDDLFFNKVDLLRPTHYYTSIEKSMYQTISDEMVKMFATVKDFNNLIGEPANKYRDDYKHMTKLRQLFFERVGNTPDLDKFIDFYKWVDITLDMLLGHLIPASADLSDEYGGNIRTVVENTVLQRNKYKWQYPTLDYKKPILQGNILGINELLYDWEYGHAPPTKLLDHAVSFDGTDDFVNLQQPSNLNFTNESDEYTLSAWIKTIDDNASIVSRSRWTAGQFGYALAVFGTRLYARQGSNVLDSGVIVNDGQWHHVAMVNYDDGGTLNFKLYIDGVQAGATQTSDNGPAVSIAITDVLVGSVRGMNNTDTTLFMDGDITEVSIWDAALSDDQVSEVYNDGTPCSLNSHSAYGDLITWIRMGASVSGVTLPDQKGSNDGTLVGFVSPNGVFQTSDLYYCTVPESNNCLWWKDRAERDNINISSGDSNVDADRQTILNVLNNKTNASPATLGSTSSAGISIYEASTYVIRKLGIPYRFTVDQPKTIKGGSNFYQNKNIGFFNAINHFDGGGQYGSVVISGSNIDPFENCNDELALNGGKRKHSSFKAESKLGQGPFNSSDAYKGNKITPFSLYSASIDGGINDIVNTNFKQGVDITNLHLDVYGPNWEVPMQGPFTEKYVGGRPYRHVWSQFLSKSANDTDANRLEGWRLNINPNSVLKLSNADFENVNAPSSQYFRDETAKRPVNIRNIRQATGSTIIGNYTKDYDLIMTNGCAINNRFFVKNEGAPFTSFSSMLVSGVLDYNLPGGTESTVDRNEVVKNNATSSVRNSYIIVNRFAAPGDPSTMALGFLDAESQEYSAYNALTWRNLIVREGQNELYTDHAKQFGYFSDTQNSASYVLAGQAYPGTSGSVNALNYAGSASYHKVNRNPRRTPRYADAITTSSYVEDTIYDNWFVQHQIPQTDLQYAWITASVIEGYTGSATYGFEQPNFSNASLASTDITFCSASDWGSYANGLRQWGATYAVEGSTQFVPTDFAGINSNIYEPITSSTNTLGYPAGMRLVSAYTNQESYLNQDHTSLGVIGFIDGTAGYGPMSGSQAFNALILHRQGPYGWPSWKQTRGAQHPIIRLHRKENRQSFLKTTTIPNPAQFPYGKTLKSIVTQIEPPVTSKFKPLKHRVFYKKTDFTVEPISIWNSYGNQKGHFTNVPDAPGIINLNNQNFLYTKAGNTTKPLQTANQRIFMYDTLNKFILYKTPGYISGGANPIDEFAHLDISEIIYPREHYTYLSGTRQRTIFENNFWRDTRNARDTEGSPDGGPWANSQGNVVSQSMWPIDTRSRTDQPPLTASAGIDGELQNGYSIFFSPTNPAPIFQAPVAGATYNRRVPESASEGIMYAGDTLWEANTQAGVNPFYNSYGDYIEDMKRVGKDYGIIPEFRISEHMNFYINDSGVDFFADNDGYLTLTGSQISSSTDASFYAVYSHSDFMKYFKPIRKDYSDIALPTSLTLKCKAITKLLPYDGFYPADRTIQLAQLFSQSFGPGATLEGANANWKTLLTPLFAPGILYNSIKSGMAVDYPFVASAVGSQMYVTGSSVSSPTSVSSPDSGDARLSGSFSRRMPFEVLARPEAELNGIKLVDLEPNPSASINSTGTFGASTSPLFKYAMNNFLAEVPAFFLGGTSGKNDRPFGPLSTLMSQPTSDLPHPGAPKITVDGKKVYVMRIICSHSAITNLNTIKNNPMRDLNTASFLYNEPSITLYNRSFDRSKSSYNGYSSSFVGENNTTVAYGSSFGPPCETSSSLNPNEAGFEPFTPPYYNGYSHIEITYNPNDQGGDKTISDIMGEVTTTLYRECTRSGSLDDTNSICARFAMNLDSSLNWKQIVQTEEGERWMIQPKWECPVLDFNKASITLPEGGGSGSVAKGIWHQYGSIPSANSGIYISVQDVPVEEITDSSGAPAYTETAVTQSLADLLGFKNSNLADKVKIGTIPEEGKDIYEAIVAIPFILKPNGQTKELFTIDKITIDWAKAKLKATDVSDADGWDAKYMIDNNVDSKYKPADSVITMLKHMKKFVLPPPFDFLRNDIHSFAMVFFEFKMTLLQEDLVNIWQNLPAAKVRKNAASSQQYAIGQIDIGLNLLRSGGPPGSGKEKGAHDDKGYDILNNNAAEESGYPDGVQWLIFKVKQRANTNYYNLTAKKDTKLSIMADPKDPSKWIEVKTELGSDIPTYSFNWPYDFCSIIELAKIENTTRLKPHWSVGDKH